MNPLATKTPSEITVDVVVPVLNEAHVLKDSILRLRRYLQASLPYCWRIVVADNGSTDGTLELAEALAAECPEVSCIHLKQRGRGRALRQAWTHSSADMVCYMDVDLSTELDALLPLLQALCLGGYDVATGSRLMRQSTTQRCLKREFISRMYNLMVRLVLGTRFSDAQCGFKAVTRTVVDRIVPQVKDQAWFFDTELMVLSEKQGYRIKDIPVRWVEDLDSRVKIIRTAWDDIKGVFRLRRHLWTAEFARIAAENGKHAAGVEARKPSVAVADGDVYWRVQLPTRRSGS